MAEIFNIVDANRQAVQSGTALGQVMANNYLRMQQLKSEDALRRMQEAQMAQRMALELDKYHRDVEAEAQMKKAMAEYNTLTTPTVGANGLPTGTVGAGGASADAGLDTWLKGGNPNGPYMSTGKPDIGPPTAWQDVNQGMIDQAMGARRDRGENPQQLGPNDPVPDYATQPAGQAPAMPNPVYTPNKGQAMMKAFGPLVRTPAQAEKLLLDAATVNLREEQAAKARKQFQPGFTTAIDPATGQRRTIFNSSPNSAQLVQEEGDKPLSGIGKMQADLKQAIKDGRTDDVKDLQNAITTEASGRGIAYKVNPDGSVEITQGPMGNVAGSMTAAQAGKLKEQAAFSVDAAKRIEDLKPALSSIFGPGAAAGELIVDKALSNIAPQLLDKKRVKGREAARYVKENLLIALNKGQGPLTNKDVERLSKLYPAIEGLEQAFESPARAKVVLTELQQQIARNAYVQGRIAGVEADVDSLSFLSPRFLSDEATAGRITRKQFTEAWNASPYAEELSEIAQELRNGRR